jgi:hypothetical protein
MADLNPPSVYSPPGEHGGVTTPRRSERPDGSNRYTDQVVAFFDAHLR